MRKCEDQWGREVKMINWERVALDLEREIVRLTKENEELRQRLEIDPRTKYDGIACRDETIKILEREVAQQGFYNEELRKQCDTLEFRAGDALDRAVRAEQENEELRNAIDQEMVIAHLGVFNRGDDPVKAIKELMLWSQGVGEYFAKEELAALKAQSTEPVAVVHEVYVAPNSDGKRMKTLSDRCIKAMLLLAEVEPHLDEWNFPITLNERVTALCNEHFGEVRPMAELNAGTAE